MTLINKMSLFNSQVLRQFIFSLPTYEANIIMMPFLDNLDGKFWAKESYAARGEICRLAELSNIQGEADRLVIYKCFTLGIITLSLVETLHRFCILCGKGMASYI